MEWTESVSESESRSLTKAVYWLAAASAVAFLALLLGCVVVLIDDCLPGLSEFKAVDYWRVDYWCLSGTVEYWYSVSTGSETYSGWFWFWFWVEMCSGSGIKDEFVFVVCVVHW